MRRFLLIAAAFALTASAAQAQFLVNGTPTITLDTSTISGYPMNVAWHPGFNQYYGAGGGSPGSSGVVWDAAGNLIQNLTPINEDYRSLYYNANTARLELATYSASGTGFPNPDSGILEPLLNGSGQFLGTYNILLAVAPGLASDQTVPAFDAGRNLLYSYDGNFNASDVNRVDRNTGLQVGTTTLDLGAAGNPSIMTYAMAYDPATDALLTFATDGSDRALAFDSVSGAFLASINLPGLGGGGDTAYSMGFANGQFFIWDTSAAVYRGYLITNAAVPEPTSLALVGLAGAGMAGGWRFRRRKSSAARKSKAKV